MKKALALLAGLALLLVATPGLADGHGRHGHHGRYGHGYGWGYGRPAYRHWHGGHARWYGPRVVIGVGPGFWPGWWYGAPPAYESRTVIVERPVYVERPTVPSAPPAPAPSAGYWYYCQSAGGYYPNVPSCPEPWVPVPPQPR